MSKTRVSPSVSRANANLVLMSYFFVKSIPMLISALSIYLGYRLFILGVTGQASLSVKTNSISGQLLNAAPGLFFAIGGLVCLMVSIRKGIRVDLGGQMNLCMPDEVLRSQARGSFELDPELVGKAVEWARSPSQEQSSGSPTTITQYPKA
jgi:hypothetical protein